VPESTEERRKPPIKITLPGFVHGRPHVMPTTHESRKTRSGNPKNAQPLKKNAKVVLSVRVPCKMPKSPSQDFFMDYRVFGA
jgi:hypothetical protein